MYWFHSVTCKGGSPVLSLCCLVLTNQVLVAMHCYSDWKNSSHYRLDCASWALGAYDCLSLLSHLRKNIPLVPSHILPDDRHTETCKPARCKTTTLRYRIMYQILTKLKLEYLKRIIIYTWTFHLKAMKI